MNTNLLNTEVQAFIANNIKSEIAELALKGTSFEGINTKELIEQVEAKKRSETKLSTWFNTKKIYWPNKLNIEQTSSEVTAKHKSSLISGLTLVDLTGGFGVDAYYFSKEVESVTHYEINTELSGIVTHNFKKLGVSNIECLNENGIEALKKLNQKYDWIYIDPSRRDNAKNKVFLLSDCAPDVAKFQDLFLKYAKNVMIKTSPLLDISATLLGLHNVKAIYVVAIKNEVKELLWILERNYTKNVEIKTVNIQNKNTQTFHFNFEEESKVTANYSQPLTYLYEPNSALLKAGAFNILSTTLNVFKLHKHSHLYTSNQLIEFPGRCFKIEKIVSFNKKSFAKENITKANITTRNFPLSVSEIRKKLKVKDGGTIYLFFTTDLDSNKIILRCSKIQ